MWTLPRSQTLLRSRLASENRYGSNQLEWNHASPAQGLCSAKFSWASLLYWLVFRNTYISHSYSHSYRLQSIIDICSQISQRSYDIFHGIQITFPTILWSDMKRLSFTLNSSRGGGHILDWHVASCSRPWSWRCRTRWRAPPDPSWTPGSGCGPWPRCWSPQCCWGCQFNEIFSFRKKDRIIEGLKKYSSDKEEGPHNLKPLSLPFYVTSLHYVDHHIFTFCEGGNEENVEKIPDLSG